MKLIVEDSLTFIAIIPKKGDDPVVIDEPGEYDCIAILRIGGIISRFSSMSQPRENLSVDKFYYPNDYPSSRKLQDLTRKHMTGTFGTNGHRIVDRDDTYKFILGKLYNITRKRNVLSTDGANSPFWRGAYMGNGKYK